MYYNLHLLADAAVKPFVIYFAKAILIISSHAVNFSLTVMVINVVCVPA